MKSLVFIFAMALLTCVNCHTYDLECYQNLIKQQPPQTESGNEKLLTNYLILKSLIFCKISPETQQLSKYVLCKNTP